MSLPSINTVAQLLGINLNNPTADEQEKLLAETMKVDLPLGWNYLHQTSHLDPDVGGGVDWDNDPKSELGKQLIRIHASDAMRRVAEKVCCHGKKLTFVNCCKGRIGNPPENVLLLQIHSQSGHLGKADC